MRTIFVQHRGTKSFLNEEGEWTTDAEQARNFPTSLNAVVYCVQKQLANVQLLVRSHGPPARELIVRMDEEPLHQAIDFAGDRTMNAKRADL